METIGLIGLRKVQEDFAAVCKTLKDELANPELGPAIAEEVVKLGNDMDARLDELGEDLAPAARDEERLNWIRHLVEWQKEIRDHNEFLIARRRPM